METRTVNEELFDKALDAIVELFSDTSVSQSECKNNLESLIGEIEILLDTLKIN